MYSIYSCFRVVRSSTIIPRRTYRFSSDHRSQAPSGLVSTRMGDRLGNPSVVGLFFFLFGPTIKFFLSFVTLSEFKILCIRSFLLSFGGPEKDRFCFYATD